MTKSKDTILTELNKSINKILEQIETLESLTINKTKNGAYFKTISKKGFEIKDKEYCDLYFETYDNKYCLKYYTYHAIYFKDYAELETKRDAELERLNKYLNEYTKQKEYTINNYESFLKKVSTFYESLTADEQDLLKNMNYDLYNHFRFFN